MGRLNKYDGTGNSIVATDYPTATVDTNTIHPELGSCRGLVSNTTGTVKVKLPGNADPEELFVFAGKDCLYNVITIYDDGVDVPLSDIQLFW